MSSVSCLSSNSCYATASESVSASQCFYTQCVPVILNTNLSGSYPVWNTQLIPYNIDPQSGDIDFSINNVLNSISCVSSSVCYASGESDAGGAAINITTDSGSNCNLVPGLTPETFAYNLDGYQTLMTDYSKVTTTKYNNLNEVISTTDYNNRTTSYLYDANGNVTCIAYQMPSGQSNCNNSPSLSNYVVDYSYNADDKITQLTDWLSNSISFTYNNDSKITNVTYPTNGTYSLSVSLGYDTMGFLTSEEINGSSSGNILTQRNLEEPISSVQVNNGNPQPVSYNVANQITQGSTQSNSGTDYYYG